MRYAARCFFTHTYLQHIDALVLLQLLHAEDGCGHWNDDHGWITDGCRLVQAAGDVKRCECNHLTDFTLIVVSETEDPPSPPDQICLFLGY